ncbi:GNAT family N-acetyltransferase [Deinococcus taeanensis]|uniref:GNAT family N-acetyltransferase n=1 Tax=Deinococcus taeanensis TaxID=2737050 RepID=UPI001CDD49D2|nr:GNAT family N-acetyltransferase [Deinococcus taeanensis]UBV42889.1 GNAT family N-acetyltransferase [Deinococcus taeanensis]
MRDPWAFRRLEDVQVTAWGYVDREVTPGTLFRVSAVTGGIVLGAYEEADPERPVGLAFGFPALQDGEWWHHSHLLAVDPACRGSGLAVALKHAQRERALAQGLTRMTWTFDPLVARNARLNLGKLGAVTRTYLPDWYALEEDRVSAFPADRLMVEWDLRAPRAERPAPAPRGVRVLEALGDGPGAVLLSDAPELLIEVPVRAETLPGPVRRAWRLALREALSGALALGYTVVDLAREGERAFYVLVR